MEAVLLEDALGDDALGVDVAAVRPDLERRFVEFVATHRDRARRLAWRLVGGDDAAAEDVSQDAFMKAYAALPKFREDARLETWFYRILVRQAHSYRRWRAVREVWTSGSEHDPADPSPVAARDPALQRRIASAVQRLSRGQREAFILVHLEGFKVSEAAELMGRAEGTVKSHLHRALKALRHELADVKPAAGAKGEPMP